MTDWFSSFANQALQFADNLADSLVTQASEAQQQLLTEQNKLKDEEDLKSHKLNSFSTLPWETENESLVILSQDLMEKILSLSVNEENFLIQAPNGNEVYFSFKDFIPMAMNLLKLDSNLARMHSKLSPKMEEELFWFNYYCRVTYLREASGIDGQQAKLNSQKFNLSDIVFQSVVVSMSDKNKHSSNVLSTEAYSSTFAVSPLNKESFGSTFLVNEEDKLAAEVRDALTVADDDESHMKRCSEGDIVSEDEDDIDLDDLDDLLDDDECLEEDSAPTVSTDFEQIGRSDCEVDEDDELEAQIARELADK